jgi:hydroxymethylglutaryl-CoA lyase
MRLPDRVTITEVGPRDGLQNESRAIPLEDKVRLVDALSRTGLKRIEAASFVSPKAIPQMANASEVMAGIERRPGITYVGLVPNETGARNAIAAKVDEISVVVSASEGHNRANVNRSVAESLEAIRNVGALARESGIPWTAYISTSFGCPYDGAVPSERVVDIAQQLQAMSPCRHRSATPSASLTPGRSLASSSSSPRSSRRAAALHFHDTRGMASLTSSLRWRRSHRIRRFHRRAWRLPVRSRRPGNVATEDMVAAHAMGVDTGAGLDALLEVAWLAEEIIGRPLEGDEARSPPAFGAT